ncbi:MAG TPA: hypothetical protein PKC45_09130 [Gemmatales bacterium]|nr:hypothetical protein [Gemmatales bacterium]
MSRLCLSLGLLAGLSLAHLPPLGDYDPLTLPPGGTVHHDLEVSDSARTRALPIRVYLPAATEPAPVVLFSHGLGGNREGNAYLGIHWSRRGYVVVFLQHPGSDDSVWKDQPLAQRMSAMRRAANAENFRLRTGDVPVLINQLEKWQAEKGHLLAGRLDLTRLGMSGHSFGAVTTQAVSGQRFPVGPSLIDGRIKAAVIMSPSCPRVGDAGRAFGQVAIPWLLMTGTRDLAPIGDADLKSRLGVYPALPSGSKYELLLHEAEHSAFTDRGLPGDRLPRNPNHHRAILALSTAFWDAYLRDDAAARAWLDGAAARKVLEPDDRWQHK